MSGYSGTDGGGYPGLTPYYTGPAGTEGIGECSAGTKDGDGNIVEPEVTPQPEVSDGIDNDCDGQTDEGTELDCNDSDPSTIDTYDAETNSCSNEPDPSFDADGDTYTIAQGDCDDTNASIYPAAIEVVDGVDNDCDGDIDES
jgi:hypothetical protein